MQRLEQLKAGRVSPDENPVVVSKAPARPRGLAGEGALEGAIVPRKVSRSSNQRRESRHHGLAGNVQVIWVEGETEAQVVNVSECGLMIEAPITPGIGDVIEIAFDGCDPVSASVIWRKGYRLGLDFGQPVIDLFPTL